MTKELIEEINSHVYAQNTDEIEECVESGLSSDGGEHWVNADKVIDALTEKGYILIKQLNNE